MLTIIGGYTALSTKGVASLLSGSLWRTLTFPITYLLAFILVTTAVFQIRYLNRALQRFDSTQVIPTQFVMFTISVIVGSAVLYRDFESADAERVGKFIGGCALTFSGVYLITSGRGGQADEGDEEADVEEGINLVDEETQHDTLGDGREMVTTPVTGDKMLSLQSPRRPSSRPLSRLNLTTSTTSRPFTPPSAGLDSPLMENPWMSSQERLTSRPPVSQHATTSSVPGAVSGNQPSTPRPDAKHRYASMTSERPSGKSRKSLAGLFPGPLSSPLSSSLSAVVADTLRKGVDSPTRLRHRRVELKRSRSQKSGTDANGRQDSQGEETPLKPKATRAESDTNKLKFKTQSKSLSEALGSFFHPDHDRNKHDSHSGEDEEAHRDEDDEHRSSG